MPTESSIEIIPGELAQIVESVFVTMMRLDVAECPTPWFPGGERLTSAVHLAGDWNGAVLLECDRLQACRFAARFLSQDGPPIVMPASVDDVVRDVLGELANMIGGNLKCVLAGGVKLSMPAVVDGSEYSLRICKATLKERLAFQCAEGVFWITVLTTQS